MAISARGGEGGRSAPEARLTAAALVCLRGRKRDPGWEDVGRLVQIDGLLTYSDTTARVHGWPAASLLRTIGHWR